MCVCVCVSVCLSVCLCVCVCRSCTVGKERGVAVGWNPSEVITCQVREALKQNPAETSLKPSGAVVAIKGLRLSNRRWRAKRHKSHETV